MTEQKIKTNEAPEKEKTTAQVLSNLCKHLEAQFKIAPKPELSNKIITENIISDNKDTPEIDTKGLKEDVAKMLASTSEDDNLAALQFIGRNSMLGGELYLNIIWLAYESNDDQVKKRAQEIVDEICKK